MIKPRRKMIVGIILMLILAMGFMGSILMFSVVNNFKVMQLFEKEEELKNYAGVIETVREMGDKFHDVFDRFYIREQVKVDLAAEALSQIESDKEEITLRKLGDGYIVKIENDVLTAPQGARSGLLKCGKLITGTQGFFDYYTVTMDGERQDVLFYRQITGPYYFVEIVNGAELREYASQKSGLKDTLYGMEYAYGMRLFLICPDRKNSKYFVNYPSDVIYEQNSAMSGELVSTKDLDLPENISEFEDLGVSIIKWQGELAHFVVENIEELDCKLLLIIPEERAAFKVAEETSIGIMVALTLCVIFLVYIISIYTEIADGTKLQEKRIKHSPARIRVITVSYGIISALAVFAVCLFMRSLGNLYQEINTQGYSIQMLETRLKQRDLGKEQETENKKALYVEYGEEVADLLRRYPKLNDKISLKRLSGIVGAKYIMIYDAYGRQVSTSSDYINMELGPEDPDKATSTSDFRRILKGVRSIAHDSVRDEVTGRTLELIGVRTEDLQNGGYGVLILAMPPKNDKSSEEEEINSIMKSVTRTGRICFSVDTADEIISNTSDRKIIYHSQAEYAGIKKSMIRGGVSDFIRIDGTKYYCMSSADSERNRIYYFCTPNDLLFENSVNFAIFCALGYMVVFALLSIYLLFGYTDKMFEEAEIRGAQPAEAGKKSGGNLGILSYAFQKFKEMKPEKKAFITLRIILALVLINLFIDYSRRSAEMKGVYVLDYIIGGKWERGINLFSITAMVSLFCAMAVGMFFVRFILGTMGNMMNSRGQTICRLIANMIGYLSIIVYLYYALAYLGVDTNAILASVGVMGLGLTMGARDLIADILAGISLIFEGEYQVGDIVSIDGYRGMVQEVGVRTTKIVGRGGNIKTIGNKDIKNVINLTKLNSWVAITIKVDVTYPLIEVEEILAETLPRVGQQHKEIISGPYYKGVLSVEGGFAVLSIIAECNEDNYYKVERTLVREVLVALREKNVPVK